MKAIVVGLMIILALLEYKFWIGTDSIIRVWELRKTIRTHELELSKLKQRNPNSGFKN